MSAGRRGKHLQYPCDSRRIPSLVQAKSDRVEKRTQRSSVPKPVYLRIHAASCRVAHLSGAGEYIDKLLEDLGIIQVLSEDGSSAHVLSFVLQPLDIQAKVQVTPLSSTRATPMFVLARLRGHPFAHFVCRGILELRKPFEACRGGFHRNAPWWRHR